METSASNVRLIICLLITYAATKIALPKFSQPIDNPSAEKNSHQIQHT